jgi:hypothetical protein
MGRPEQRTPLPNPPGPQDLSGTTDLPGAVDADADSAEAAVPSDGLRADGLAWSTPRHADDSTTRPSWSGPTSQFDARDSESSFKCKVRRGPGRVPFKY